MINLPFNKWTLNFDNPEYEALYDEHANKLRITSFRALSLLIAFAALICLILFLLQQQPLYLIIFMAAVTGGCFFLFLLSKKLQSYMKQLFSLMYVWSIFACVIISYGGFEIPDFVLGFNSGCMALGTLSYSDNRLKVVYIVITPIALLGTFKVYQINSLQFIFQTFAAVTFIGICSYMNEYTSRWAFSLNIIAQKQKEIIYDFVNDPMLAISINNRTQQFILEFNNKKFEDHLNIKEIEDIKLFLRTSYCIDKVNESINKCKDITFLKKLKTLEEILYQKIRQREFFKQPEILSNICYVNPTGQPLEMTISIKQLDYGKPILIIVIKSQKTSKIHQIYEQRIAYYEKAILNQSQQIAAELINIYRKTRQISLKFSDQKCFTLIQCLYLQIINNTRNYIIYYQKEKLFRQISNFDCCKLSDYLLTLEQYFNQITNNSNKQFEMLILSDKNQQIKLNTKFLTQIIINFFEFILCRSLKETLITLSIQVEQYVNPQKVQKNSVSHETFRLNEYSECGLDQKLFSFCFCFISDQKINLVTRDGDGENCSNNNEEKVVLQKEQLSLQVSYLLLGILGPNNNSCQIKSTLNQTGKYYENVLHFYIYSDQSLLGTSYIKQTLQAKNEKKN